MSAPVEAFRLRTVVPDAKPDSETKFQPPHRWIWEIPGKRPNTVIVSAAVPFNQKPRPLGIANVEGSDGRAVDHPKPPAEAPYLHAPGHARPAAMSPNVGSRRSIRLPPCSR